MTGPRIYFEIPIFGGLPITETLVNSWIVMLVILGICLFLSHNLKVIPKGKQIIAEKAVTALDDFVGQTMGSDKMAFVPYFMALMLFSFLSSLSSLFTLRPPTADLNTTLGWALMTFFLVQYNSIRRKGIKNRLKGFAEPMAFMVPLNLLSEFSNPVSLAFRHFGNIAGGMVITSLLYDALAAVGNLPIPIFQIGLPGFLSIYFDLFTSALQAFIFCMLSMVFVAMAMDD